jgi:uncharacterized membrane protein
VHPRSEILGWAAAGRIAEGKLRPALEAAGALPHAADWRRFLDRLLLFMGAVMLAASVVFFFAYNWQDLGRTAKFALVEVPLVAALVLVWRLGFERLSGQAALLVASILVGALLALVGQVYQTGADTFELFSAWAVAILPWTLLGRFAALWLVWLALVNLAVGLYFSTFHGIFGIAFGPERQLWVLLAIDVAALAAWEYAALRGTGWLQGRWGPRLIATATGVFATSLAVMAIFLSRRSAWDAAIWLGWLVAAYLVYRRRVRDLYVLAGGALSIIVVSAAFLGKHLPMRDAGEYLLIGLVVIGMSAAAGWWLRLLAAEEPG